MNKPRKNTPVVSIPKDIDMWSDTNEAEVRRAKAQKLVKEFRTLAQKVDIPLGWTVEIFGGHRGD